MKPTHFATAFAVAVLLAACGDNVSGVRFTKDGGNTGKSQPQSIRALTAGEIKAAAVESLASFDEASVASSLLAGWQSYTPDVRAKVLEAQRQRVIARRNHHDVDCE